VIAVHGMRRAGALGLVAALFAGCLDVPVPSSSPTAAPTPEPTPITTTYDLERTAWYEGLLIHVDSAVATLDERGGPVSIRIRLENPGEDDGELTGRILLQLSPDSSEPPVVPNRDSKVPPVPARGFAGAVLTYDLQGVASVDDAAILIGEAPLHVARIPLTSAGGTARLFEPVELELSGAGAVGDLRLALRGGLLRWDLPDWSEELPDSVQALTLTYDATYLGDFAGGFAFTADNIQLRLPDGTRIAPRRDGHSQSIELLGAHQTKKSLFSRFDIPAGMTGRFALIAVTDSGSKAIPFLVGG
jgi:hypothetical protein